MELFPSPFDLGITPDGTSKRSRSGNETEVRKKVPVMTINDVLLTVKQVKERLGLSLASVYAIIKKGKLAAVRIGCNDGAIRVHETDLADYLAASVQRVTEPLAARKAPVPMPALKHIRLKR